MTLAATAPRQPAYDVDEPDVSGLITGSDASGNSIFSEKQQRLLTEPLDSSWTGPPVDEGGFDRFIALARVGLFFSVDKPPIVPDVSLSWDATIPRDLRQKENSAYFVWQFGQPPNVIIEIVSNREGGELGERLRRYQTLRVSYYVVYDPLCELGGPALQTFEIRGGLYMAVERAWFERVGLGLIEWEGVFEGANGRWLRWCTGDGRVVPTGAERAQTAEARAERLAARLRDLGVDPNGVG